MEFLTELAGKMTIDNLFKIDPSTDFSYSYIVFGFLVGLVIFSLAFEFFAKKQSNKFLKKALRGKIGQIKWTFPLVGGLLLVFRLEGIPFLGMKILLVLYFLTFIIYSIFLILDIKNDYFKRLKKQEKYSKK